MASHQDVETDPAGEQILSWRIACADADRAPAKAGHEQTFVATPAERQAVVEALGLTSCSALSAILSARPRPGGRYSVEGRIKAGIEQSCVVTLDPVQSQLDEPVAGEFCPADDVIRPAAIEAHFDPDEQDEPLAIEDGQLTVGQLIYEHLALTIDPFPRQAGVDPVKIEHGPRGAPRLDAQTPDARPNPFAALAKLKPRKGE